MKNTTERRFLILEYLLKVRRTTRVTIAVKFGVSLRTVDRDILILSCSFPITAVQGGNGGIGIAEGYYLGIKYLTEAQAILLEKISATLTGEDLLLMREILKTFKKPS